MSSSHHVKVIFLSDTDRQIKPKINRYAFPDERDTAEQQYLLGSDVSADVSHGYLQISGRLVSNIHTYATQQNPVHEIIQKYSDQHTTTNHYGIQK